MNYKSVNELQNFNFQDAEIRKFEIVPEGINFELEAVIINARNSNNQNFTDSYASTLFMRLLNAKVQTAVKEGYKYYDANDVLIDEVADTPMTEKEIFELAKNSEGYYLFDVVKVEDNLNTTGKFLYLIGIDSKDDTEEENQNSYWLQVEFDKSILEWDRYMNRVQKI